MAEFVFVYGSLKRGLHNHQLMRPAEFWGEAATEAPEFRVGNVGAYPEVTRTESSTRGFIAGEIYKCSASVLKDLDRLESNGEWYKREKIQLRTSAAGPKVKPNCKAADCLQGWIYLWLKQPCPDVNPIRVESGFPVYCWSPPRS